MNQQEFEFMNDLARAFERRYRDTRSLNRCLSIEGRYMGEEVYPHKPEIGLRYGEGGNRVWNHLGCLGV